MYLNQNLKHENCCDFLKYNAQVNGEGDPFAVMGNGRMQCMAAPFEPMVKDCVIYGYSKRGIKVSDIEFRIPAVYDADTGKKYSLERRYLPSSILVFKPEKMSWLYDFEDFELVIDLFLPPTLPGMIFDCNIKSRLDLNIRLFLEERGENGTARMQVDSADYNDETQSVVHHVSSSNIWDATSISQCIENVHFGTTGSKIIDTMINTLPLSVNKVNTLQIILARAFSPEKTEAQQIASQLISNYSRLKQDTLNYWNHFFEKVPYFNCSDPDYKKQYYWFWSGFRSNKMDVPIGRFKNAGFSSCNNICFQNDPMICGDQKEHVTAEMYNKPELAKHLLEIFCETQWDNGHFQIAIHTDFVREYGQYYCITPAWLTGLLYRYLMISGDYEFLFRKYGNLNVFQRFVRQWNVIIENQFQDSVNLFPAGNEDSASNSDGMYTSGMELVERYRISGKEPWFLCDLNASFAKGLECMANICKLAENKKSANYYSAFSTKVSNAINQHLWDESKGVYLDRNLSGKFSDHISSASFLTGLNANQIEGPGGMADSNKAKRLADLLESDNFYSDYGFASLSRSDPFFDADCSKGIGGGLDMHYQAPIVSGLYAHGQINIAHRLLKKIFRRFNDNCGLGPKYKHEAQDSDNGSLIKGRFPNYPNAVYAMTTMIYDGVFGIYPSLEGLQININSPWPYAELKNILIRSSKIDISLYSPGKPEVTKDGSNFTCSYTKTGALFIPWNAF